MVHPRQTRRSLAVHLIIHGRVQGVGFRYYAQEQAVALSLAGWVKNCPDGSVEAYAEGSRPVLDDWINRLRKGPPMSRAEKIDIDWLPPFDKSSEFSIVG